MLGVFITIMGKIEESHYEEGISKMTTKFSSNGEVKWKI